MRRAELLMAAVLAAFSIYLMWKSAELPVGWIPGEGPGGGAFPFWLAVGMLVCTILIIIRWFRRADEPARSTDAYMDEHALVLFALVAGSLAVTIGIIEVAGVYVAIPLFLIFYLRVMGKHHWALIGSIAVATPVILFFFFEIALKITLPKGITETWFYPLYAMFL
ncbi:MAG: tripartite tricarboxylate transporter TctB family protein [Rhodospirillaceae bacterium]|nr:tripartite tricarboxylate transporter TctB family protein [Rhodospirillaceae bacterium]